MQQYVAGVHRALAHFEILSPDHPSVTTGAPRLDTVDPPPAAWGVDASAAAKAFSGHLQSQNITPVGGIWRCRVKLWDTVVEGDLIGDISDHFGNGLFQLRAQVPGTVRSPNPLTVSVLCDCSRVRMLTFASQRRWFCCGTWLVSKRAIFSR